MRPAQQLAREMYPGWNLGNTMEAVNGDYRDRNAGLDTEIHWQGMRTTRDVIQLVRQQGFRSVRIPCNWVSGHVVDSAATTIDPLWLQRVQQIVDWCLDEGLYVVLNDHYDGGWLEQDGFLDGVDANAKALKLHRVWTQVARHFRDYGDRLLFAGLNEPFHNVQADSQRVSLLCRYEQTFISAVRATGGNNRRRTLIVQGPETNIDHTVQYMQVGGPLFPTDKVKGRLMMEVHYYDPWNFCGLEEDASWGRAFYYYNAVNHQPTDSLHNPTWGDGQRPFQQMALMRQHYCDKGIPVIIGEYGANWRQLPTPELQQAHNASIQAFFHDVTLAAIQNGCIPFVWDINSNRRHGTRGVMTIFNRMKLKVFAQPALDGIRQGVAEAHFPY